MIGFGKRARAKPKTKEGQRIYAIGDVHGRLDLMRQLLSLIVRHYHNTDLKAKQILILFLGDVIDRGPQSARCLERIMNLVELRGAQLLLGNHEDMLLASLDGDQDAQTAWLRHGGDQTLESYGIELPSKDEDSVDFAERLRAGLPDEAVAFLKSRPTSYRSGDYLFVHAGVRPGVSLKRQESRDLFSIRDEFTQSTDWHGAMIVHGHSIVEQVEILSNRIACDTAAYRSDRLSCICLQDDYREVLCT